MQASSTRKAQRLYGRCNSRFRNDMRLRSSYRSLSPCRA